MFIGQQSYVLMHGYLHTNKTILFIHIIFNSKMSYDWELYINLKQCVMISLYSQPNYRYNHVQIYLLKLNYN